MNQLANIDDIDTQLETTDHLTKEMLHGAVPDKRFRKYITDDLVDVINAEPDSELRRVFRDNALCYASVLAKGAHGLASYIHAVKFVSLKLLGDKNSTAYSKVFPDRYHKLAASGKSPSYIASFADNYNKNVLVTKIMEQTLVPTYVLNQNIYQDAINVQANLMATARSETVRQKAAESLMNNLLPPAAAKVELDITSSDNTVAELNETVQMLAAQQLKMIMNGQATAAQIAASDVTVKKPEEDIVDAEVVDK